MNEWIKWLIQIFIREEFDKKKHYELMKKIRNTISLQRFGIQTQIFKYIF